MQHYLHRYTFCCIQSDGSQQNYATSASITSVSSTKCTLPQQARDSSFSNYVDFSTAMPPGGGDNFYAIGLWMSLFSKTKLLYLCRRYLPITKYVQSNRCYISLRDDFRQVNRRVCKYVKIENVFLNNLLHERFHFYHEFAQKPCRLHSNVRLVIAPNASRLQCAVRVVSVNTQPSWG